MPKAETRRAKTRMSRGSRRLVADRAAILAAAREIGEAAGWKTVTIRALADKLGYTAPVLYEHFRNKEDVLTQVAVDGLHMLHRELQRDLPADANTAILALAERYWTFMREHPQMYRLINTMDGMSVDGKALGIAARGVCETTAKAIRAWVKARRSRPMNCDLLADEVWALLHGMASLYMNRAAVFDSDRARQAVLNLLEGALSSSNKHMLGNEGP